MQQSLFAILRRFFRPESFVTSLTALRRAAGWRWQNLLSDVLDENIVVPGTDLSQLSELKQHCDYPLVNHAVRQAKLEK